MAYASVRQPLSNGIRRGSSLDKLILDWVLACYHQGKSWWSQTIPGTKLSMLGHVYECRKRYQGRRSVASLDSDVKSKPFPRSSNIGIGAEQIFGEFLIPVILANTRDLDPQLQVTDNQTEKVDDSRTAFHNTYQKRLFNRKLLEHSTREVLTIGSCYHKSSYETLWKQREVAVSVYAHPLSGQPMLQMDATGQVGPMFADPKRPAEQQPIDPMTGRPLRIVTIPNVDWLLQREGPVISVVTADHVFFPPKTTEVDPIRWDWVVHEFEQSPWWFLGRDGDPWDGRLQNLEKLWRWLGLDPNKIYQRPQDTAKLVVKLAEYQGPFAVSYSGQPVEIAALVATEAQLLLGWRVTIFPRRTLFHRQLWNRGEFPLGIGIPESVRGERDYLDASVNQDADAGNVYNHPPVLFSDLAMLDDEEYELVGPGTRWIMRDINGAKVLPVIPSLRNAIERENWILGIMQRKWGVTDLNLNAPTSSLSPNIQTATAALAVMNQGSIKFGHLTKRLAETDSEEYQFAHDAFSTMLANPITVVIDEAPLIVEPKDREQFFSSRYRVSAVGNGITTNPLLRQGVMERALAIASTHPLVQGDPDLQEDMLEDYFESLGLKYQIKPAQEIEQMRVFNALMKTPEGQAQIPVALRQVMEQVQSRLQQNGNPNVLATR